MCSDFAPNRAGSRRFVADAFVVAVDGVDMLGTLEVDGFENRNRMPLSCSIGFGGYGRRCALGLRFGRGCRVGYSLSWGNLGLVVKSSLSSGLSAVSGDKCGCWRASGSHGPTIPASACDSGEAAHENAW